MGPRVRAHRRNPDDLGTVVGADRFLYQGPVLEYEDSPWRSWPELTVRIPNLDYNLKTFDIYEALSKFGKVERIDLSCAKAGNGKNASVTFSPPPSFAFWGKSNKLNFSNSDCTIMCQRCASVLPLKRIFFRSTQDGNQEYLESMEVDVDSLTFGTMHQLDTMMTMLCLDRQQISMRLNLRLRQLIVHFTIMAQSSQPEDIEMHGAKRRRLTNTFQPRQYKIVIPIRQLRKIHEIVSETQEKVVIISLSSPPEYYRRADNLASSHTEENHWSEKMAWFRETEIGDVLASDKTPEALRKPSPLVDIGRWTTFKLTFGETPSVRTTLKSIKRALIEYNIEFSAPEKFNFIPKSDPPALVWMNSSHRDPCSNEERLQVLMNGAPDLTWKVKYQLEACISHECLNEHNISIEFINTVAKIPEKRALEILEHALETGERFFEPMEIFQLKAPRTTSSQKLPPYCILTRAVNITPTTMYMSSPTVEVSNRILRKYVKYSDHFLRVRFSDERNRGQVRSSETRENDAIFTKFYRCLKDGIIVGGRHFDFLASGNSQFRERGAYFFARAPGLSAATIRQKLGNFEGIHTASKLASRLGLAFSTTRSTEACKFQIVQIEDIIRHGYNFTDGVGKISTFLSQLITIELGHQSRNWNPISAFQFRLGGMKGVLAIDPQIGGREIHIRNSQVKFPAEYGGLEVIRYSLFCSAYLNRQIILVLKSLQVDDDVFLQKLRIETNEFAAAMSDPELAISKLRRHVDSNQMTTVIAEIVESGFMKSQEPFAIATLHLWRIHSLKYLKEKARLAVDKGAFVLGCTDETKTLKGYQKGISCDRKISQQNRVSSLPEIFLQIDRNDDGCCEVITGVCAVARNPSLHPGDIRIVLAVDVPALHHLSNVVVFPQTGDCDIPSMCSGGDLDGDDFLVIWDPDLIPPVWDEEPMHFASPLPSEKEGPVPIEDVAKFFVNYMKKDCLKLIAVAHMAQADWLPRGIRDPRCLELAELHSKAVDYAKSGVPVTMEHRLRPRRYPHFLPNTFRSPEQIYRSRNLLGRMYDAVETMDFEPSRELSFDDRILNAYPSDQRLEQEAREIKEDYDAALQRIMSQHAIETEFEVWTAFVLKHAGLSNDYSFHEEIGRLSRTLRARFQSICYEKLESKDFNMVAPLVVAMYRVTCDEVEAHLSHLKDTRRLRETLLYIGAEQGTEKFPFISFPWIFYAELGRIAKDHSRISRPISGASETECSSEERRTFKTLEREDSQAVKRRHLRIPLFENSLLAQNFEDGHTNSLSVGCKENSSINSDPKYAGADDEQMMDMAESEKDSILSDRQAFQLSSGLETVSIDQEQCQLQDDCNLMELDVENSLTEYETPPEYPSPTHHSVRSKNRSTAVSGTMSALQLPGEITSCMDSVRDDRYDLEEGEIVDMDVEQLEKWELMLQALGD